MDFAATASLLSIPLIAPALLPAVPVLTVPFIITTSAFNAASAGYAYYSREVSLEQGNGIVSYMESGAIKYGYRQVFRSAFMIMSNMNNGEALGASKEVFKIVYEAVKGSVNNIAYGAAKDIDALQNITFIPVFIEGLESFVDAKISGNDLYEFGDVGIVSGALITFYAGCIYGNVIDSIHSAVDYLYGDKA